MLRVGLTGSIGCGKSTVAAMMNDLGCHIINADKMAHLLIAPGAPAYDEVVRKFGTHILAPDKTVDRTRLASIVFGDANNLAAFNPILHSHALREINPELDH